MGGGRRPAGQGTATPGFPADHHGNGLQDRGEHPFEGQGTKQMRTLDGSGPDNFRRDAKLKGPHCILRVVCVIARPDLFALDFTNDCSLSYEQQNLVRAGMSTLPLNALRFFEAAARRLSFAEAAEELNVTPAAVSRQIRLLETQLGVRLFRRLTRAVALTPEGAAALPLLTEGFARLQDGVERMRVTGTGGVLSVSVAPSLAQRWLAQRLGRFMERHPDIELVIDATERVSNFGADRVDIGLRFGAQPDPRLRAIALFEDPIFPVCAPALAARLGPSPCAADLLAHPLLHVHRDGMIAKLPRWADWLSAAGLGPVPSGGARFTQLTLAIEAAIAGHGIALASHALVSDDLAAGRLVRPLNAADVEAGALRYWIVYPPESAANPRLRAFRDWVQGEARTTGETDDRD